METTALICPLPRLAPLLAPWREVHDPSAAAGFPPHVTVLAPFLAPDELRLDDLETLRSVLAPREPIEVELARVGMFDSNVLHLLPDPDEPFRELTDAVFAQYPQAPPYGGRHDEIIPHVTVGKEIPRPQARHAARALMLALPVRIRVDVVQLWVRGPETWMVGASFPMGTEVAVAP